MDYTLIIFAVFGLLAVAAVIFAIAAIIGDDENRKEKTVKTVGLILLGIALMAMFCIVFGGLLYGALAEELPELFVIEQFEEVECENNCLKLTFNFHGDLLSFYWEGPLDLTRQVWVMVWDKVEIIDADYVEELPSGSLLFLFLQNG